MYARDTSEQADATDLTIYEFDLAYDPNFNDLIILFCCNCSSGGHVR